MTREKRLVDGDILNANRELVAPNVDDAVDQEKRVAMQQEAHDLLVTHCHITHPGITIIHLVSSVPGLPRGGSCRCPIRASSASRLSIATSRKKIRDGRAGYPTHFSPAGMSVATPD